MSIWLRQYPDEELAKTYIACKAMTDLQWKLDEEVDDLKRILQITISQTNFQTELL